MDGEKQSVMSVRDFKRTKIIATVGPSTNNFEVIKNMIETGANGLRLNFSHGNHQERDQQIEWIRRASTELNKPVAIIQDLQGPKIRIGDFDGAIEIDKKQNLRFAYQADYQQSGHIPLQYDLSGKVEPGQRLYLSDGKIKTIISSVKDGVIYATAENKGSLTKRKGINLPDTDFASDIITKKDQADLAYGAAQDIDYVALSFVQKPDDIQKLRQMLNSLGSKAKIIAKIETKKAADSMEEIIKVTDAVMVARGDLAVETSSEAVPIIQRKIIELAKKYARPSIVATHMLYSMTDRPDPTRAEVSDIATAVILGTDGVMLSDETASGQYPIESIEVMKRVVNYTEKNITEPIMTDFARVASPAIQAIPKAAISLAKELNAVAIVAETKSGATPILVSSNRPNFPIIAVTSVPQIANQLAIVYGTKSYVLPDSKQQATKLADRLHTDKVLSSGDTIVTLSGQRTGEAGQTDTIKVRILE